MNGKPHDSMSKRPASRAARPKTKGSRNEKSLGKLTEKFIDLLMPILLTIKNSVLEIIEVEDVLRQEKLPIG